MIQNNSTTRGDVPADLNHVRVFRTAIVAATLALPSAASATLPKPIDAEDIPTIIKDILEVVVQIGVVVLVLMIVIAGFYFVTAQGNEQKLKTAKNIFIWAVIGGAVLLGAWTFSVAIQKTITAL